MVTPDGAGTIDDLLEAARQAGHTVSGRLITDWVSRGLLDHPRRRPQGRGRGSAKAEFTAQQRSLFMLLLDKRRSVQRVGVLARVPVFVWLYWGDEYVPLRQARIAFSTWLGLAEVSKASARTGARMLLGSLTHPLASARARRELESLLTNLIYTGRMDAAVLTAAVRRVFEPDGQPRGIGHPAALLTVDSVVGLIEARLAAVNDVRAGRVADDDFLRARQRHLISLNEYIAAQPYMQQYTGKGLPHLYQEITLQSQADSCCVDLLTLLGLYIVHGDPLDPRAGDARGSHTR